MRAIKFIKMSGAGNDFLLAHRSSISGISLTRLARRICHRKFGIGADGLLVLEKSKKADIRMRIINADGSEAEMCGNGARCAALYIRKKRQNPKGRIFIETKAGIIESYVKADNVSIKLTEPRNLKLDIPIKVSRRILRVNFINTGVPHAVIFVQGLGDIDVVSLGRHIRYHRSFRPAGANVDFVEVLNKNSLKVRTYERGVEEETLACGTGAVASAIIFVTKSPDATADRYVINVKTQSTEALKVYFDKIKGRFTNAWLEGKVRITGQGVYYV
jgi:diaminopimelate epimerase